MLSIRKQGEPIYQLQVIRDAIRDAIRTDRMGRDEQFAKYLNDTLGMKIMPTLSRERSLDNDVSKGIPSIIHTFFTSAIAALAAGLPYTNQKD